ncbi:MAG: cellulase family glycosylhydrolase [Clostridia bacterium]|nr:cellulase family glycosylhydrolase [Clostridia bacterium]
MKLKLKKSLSIFLVILTLFSICNFSVLASAETVGFTDDDFLKTRGQDIVNQKGEKIHLKGVNLGAWLIWEDWLCPYEEATDHADIIDILTERFGIEAAYDLMNTYMDNWITEFDLDQIKAMGFNCVRVPFWYRNFYYDDNGTKILNEEGEWDFSRLDWVVEECSKRELYVVLDMHGAVGYQSDAPHSGKADSCGLYDKTEQGERYRELTDELWTAIASRFKGNPAVAMYDLLNEPMCDVDAGEIKRRINNEFIYSRLYDTVRAVDPDHIITMECIWTAIALPQAFLKGWDNVVYQVHFYNNSNFIFNLFALFTKLIYWDVPMMMGEFFPHQKTTWENCFNFMNKTNYNWFLWTYKATGHMMWESDWCLRGSKDGFHRAKIQTDSYEEIARKWGECIRTEIGFQDTGHYDKNVKDHI